MQGCGGGDGFGGDYNSSFSGTITLGSTQYVCKSQQAFDACSNSTQRDCSACSSDQQHQNTAAITATCAQSSPSNYLIPATGCLFMVNQNTQTALCMGSNLKILSGQGWTSDQLIQNGGTFSAGTGKVQLNGVVLQCVS